MTPNEYWEHDDASRDQKFYTAFCILASACSDYAVGAELRLHKKLNWACTVLYYSLVHAARLICFVETGDFPTGHNQLGKLFMCGSWRVGNSWVKRKLRRLDSPVEPISDFCLAMLPPDNRAHYGQILAKARELRDDANYEGLLISHEYSHVKVTECFGKLATTLKAASEQLLPDAVGVFKTFVDSSPRKDYWYAFLNWRSRHSSARSVSDPIGEGLYYLEASLKYRVASKRAITKVLTWLNGLRRHPDVDLWRAEEVHENIVMSAFALKNRLMNDFKNEIDNFEQQLRRQR